MTESAIGRLFLGFSARVDNCLARLTDEQVWAQGGENENAAGNLVLHVCGNVHQWVTASIGGELAAGRRTGMDRRGQRADVEPFRGGCK